MDKKGFHVGSWVVERLQERHVNLSSLSRAMKKSRQAFQRYETTIDLGDDVIREISRHIGWDLYAEVKAEKARALGYMDLEAKDAKANVSDVDGATTYTSRTVNGKDALVVSVNLDEFEDADQLRIIRYLQQLPRRGARKPAKVR